jgi:hypothetical protein
MPSISIVTIAIEQTRPNPQLTFRSFLIMFVEKIYELLVGVGRFVQNF